MSLINRNTIKDAVVTQATGVVLKKTRGFLREALGLNKKKSAGTIAAPGVIGKRQTKNFQFPLDVEGVIEYTKVVRVTSEGLTISKGVVVDGDILALAELDDPTNIDISDVHKFNPSHDEVETGFEEEEVVQEVKKPKHEVVAEKQKDKVEKR